MTIRSDNRRNARHHPPVIQAKDGGIHVAYICFVPEGKYIKRVQFKEDWLKQ
jgi:hypothetical protein